MADCGKGHFFCFACGGEPHDPCSCEEYRQWKNDLKEMSIGLGQGSKNASAMATMLWIQTNTKKCPGCNSNIMKNEGCNHMTCQACKHEFCWICMEPWSRHGTSTGGYYNCNKFKGAGPTKNTEESKLAKKKLIDSKRYIHFVERIKAHQDSADLEQKMLAHAQERIKEMQSATVMEVDASFVTTSFITLYQNRIVLCGSYIKKYYSEGEALTQNNGENKKIRLSRTGRSLPALYDTLQAELESTTEALSNAIARKRWKMPRGRIISLTHQAHTARNHFLNAVYPGRQKLLEAKEKKRRSEALNREDKKGGGGRILTCQRCTYNNTGGEVCRVCGAALAIQTKSPTPERKSPARVSRLLNHGRKYSQQLATLRGMGFTDREKCIQVLGEVDGDIQQTIQRLVSLA
eukprot:CAMPEP_0197538602 /NCGR_PEP_ID=MMETSP1318-20131121/60107_1 /TAXON_ID=552666 /ORGANISM="Partenskyella glossopodia, Strain RCC365" /LENGTH=404 /DNA_ID=CAMNT_0043097061 /DNA_START=218 /DNA_END=1432 /DNA_ORIENTATION=-